MKKIPTLFRRDPEDMARILREVHPDCQWVIDGEGVATRKYDGTCVMFDGARWWTRREVKPGKAEPSGFVAIDHDEATGKTVGWEPAEQSPWLPYLREAIVAVGYLPRPPKGTYELCGYRVNGNPEGFVGHVLIRHSDAVELGDVPRDYDGLRVLMADFPHEGIVWHHPDGRMAKLKRRDFRKAGEGK